MPYHLVTHGTPQHGANFMNLQKLFLIQSDQWVTLSIRYGRNATTNPPPRLRPRQHLWSDARGAACPTQGARMQQDLPGEGERRTGRPAIQGRMWNLAGCGTWIGRNGSAEGAASP